ncbi:hypothetical protein ACOYXF_08790 [Pseudomonas sp. Tul1A2]
MTCFICNGTATSHPVIGDFYDRECAECGRYLINKGLLAEISGKNQKLDIDRTRACIAEFLNAGLQAVISKAEVAKYQLIAG